MAGGAPDGGGATLRCFCRELLDVNDINYWTFLPTKPPGAHKSAAVITAADVTAALRGRISLVCLHVRPAPAGGTRAAPLLVIHNVRACARGRCW